MQFVGSGRRARAAGAAPADESGRRDTVIDRISVHRILDGRLVAVERELAGSLLVLVVLHDLRVHDIGSSLGVVPWAGIGGLAAGDVGGLPFWLADAAYSAAPIFCDSWLSLSTLWSGPGPIGGHLRLDRSL